MEENEYTKAFMDQSVQLIKNVDLTITFPGITPEQTIAMFGGLPSSPRRPRHTYLVPIDRSTSSPDAIWAWDQLDRCDYKPGWLWRLEQDRSQLFLLTESRAPDTYHPEEIITIYGQLLIPQREVLDRNEAGFVRWLLHAMKQLEWHECQEWLRRDGRLWDNPHAPQWTTEPIDDRAFGDSFRT